jgi:hypothetical protein
VTSTGQAHRSIAGASSYIVARLRYVGIAGSGLLLEVGQMRTEVCTAWARHLADSTHVQSVRRVHEYRKSLEVNPSHGRLGTVRYGHCAF